MSQASQAVPAPNSILIGTVALEPNRWGAISQDRKPSIGTGDWLKEAEAARFDGIELWEHHAMFGSDSEVAQLQGSRLPLAIFSSYVSFDDPDDAARDRVAGWVERLGCGAVKFNVGNDAGAVDAYVERITRFASKLPPDTRLICECHAGTLAEDPSVAASILSAVAGPERAQALVHLGDDPQHLDAMFEALGKRITHVHVNFLAQGAPLLESIEEDVRSRISRVRSHGFVGSYTIEFVSGVGKDTDRPEQLIKAAARDLALLRMVIAS